MSVRLDRALRVLDEHAPLRLAEPWDNVGLIAGDPSAEIERVLVTVDYSAAVAEEAAAAGADLVVAYHPPMFAAVKRVPFDALWARAVRSGTALYSMHTALDVVRGGTNDVLADACGVKAERQALRPMPDDPTLGLGRVGDVDATTVAELAARLKLELGLSHLLVGGISTSSPERAIRRVAVAAGAGSDLLDAAIRAQADIFVTGELRHHDALEASRRGLAVIATLHSNSERRAVRAFASTLQGALPGATVTFAAGDADPFMIV